MKTIKFLSQVAFASAVAVGATSAHAFSLGGVAGALSGGGAKSGATDVVATQTEVVVLFNTALKGLSQAQLKMANALGLKEDASVAESNAKALESGSITGKDELSSKISSSKGITDNILAKIRENVKLDDAAKAEFGSALLPYGVGVVAGLTGAKKAGESLEAASSDPMQIMKLGTLIFLAKEAPGLIKSFGESTSAISKYATYQGIDTKDLAKASGL